MHSEINLQEWLKCLFIGLFLTMVGMFLQVSKSILLLQKNTPELSFIIGVTLCYMITGILFALGFYLIKNTLPGKSRAVKGFVYAILVFSTAWFANIIGMIAFDFTGTFDLITSYKIDIYATTVVDAINLMLTGVVLGIIAEKKNSTATPPFILQESTFRTPRMNRKEVAFASVIGFLLFPISTFVFFKMVAWVIPSGINVPSDAEVWFNLSLFVPLIVTGAILPIFYSLVRDSFAGSWLQKGTLFSTFFFLFYWLMVIVFVIPFGFRVIAVINFLVVSVFPIFLIILISARIKEISSPN
jgi:hypothetical protein